MLLVDLGMCVSLLPKKAVREILAAPEIRTSVQHVDVLSALVPLALC